MPRAPRSDKGKPRAKRGPYKTPPKGLGPFPDLRFANIYEISEISGYSIHAINKKVYSKEFPAPDPDVRDGNGRKVWDLKRRDVKTAIDNIIAAYKATNAKRLKGD